MSTEEKALVTLYPVGELTEWQSEEWESDGCEDIPLSIPILKMVQPTSGMDGAEKHIGEFYRSDEEAYYAELDVVPLAKKDTRALFRPDDEQPVCASNDGFMPRPNMPLWIDPELMLPEPLRKALAENPGTPEVCTDCIFSEWDGDNPPPCKQSINLLVHHNDSVAVLRFGGKSLKVFKQFVGRKLAPKKLPLVSQRLRLFTEMKTGPQRKWAELRIQNTLMTPTEAKPYNAILKDERARFEASVGVEPDEDGGPKDVTPQWEDGSRSFRDKVARSDDGSPVDVSTGEVITEGQAVLAAKR